MSNINDHNSLQELLKVQHLSSTGSWHWDSQTNTLSFTEELQNILGAEGNAFTIEDITGKSGRLFSEESLITLSNAVEKSRYSGTPYRISATLLREGRKIRVILCGETIFDEKGAASGMRGTIQDISGLDLAGIFPDGNTVERLSVKLDELKESKQRFERAEALAHVGSWIIYNKSGIMELSDEMTRILGLNPDQKTITVSEYIKFAHPEDRDMMLEISKNIHNTEIPVNIEYRIIRADGSVRYIHGISGPAGEPGGNTEKRIGAAKDITERRMVELNLARERELFESIFEAIPVMITIYDPQLRNFRFNKSLSHLTGWTIRDAEEGNFMEKVYPDPELREEVASFMKSLEPVWREFEMTTRDGAKLPSSWTNIQLKDGRMIGIGIDNTERKRAELELKKTLEELARSNKDLEQFAYVASHDLQEPLRMISSYTRLLEKQYLDKFDERAKRYMYFITDGSGRMHSLVKDLLSYSRVTSSREEFVSTDLNTVVDDIRKDLRVAITEHKAKIEVGDLPTLNAAPTQMRQLFQNLIQNAIKFRGKDNPHIQISAERRSDDWLFSVRDNGIGIEPKYYDRIFIIFQRLHDREQYPGTGIGLSLCKKIVELHCGHIWIEPNNGQGTVFYFTIPPK